MRVTGLDKADRKATWQPVDDTTPEGRLLETKIDDEGGVRNVQTLVRRGRLWFMDCDYSVYVYYTPTHWREQVLGETT